MNEKPYGTGDSSYVAAGSEKGVRSLVDDFYDIMNTDQRFAEIVSWHPDDLAVSRDKLTRFLCGWMGGPRLYQDKYGSINIPQVHGHLKVTAEHKDQWLACMALALDRQNYADSFKQYLLHQLSIPAEVIRRACERNLTT